MGPVPHEVDDLRPGTPIGPYDLLVPLGSGGMAHVWAARARMTGEVVALKMMLGDLLGDASFRAMFEDEARIASRVRHANVCETFELAQVRDVLYLAMEWVDGTTLMHVLRPGPEDGAYSPSVLIEARLGAYIVSEVAAGLHAAHELAFEDGSSVGVVHRDVSPHNVLVGRDGSIKVTDFGVAKALGKSHRTLAGQLKGKVAYMSPEQLNGAGVDRRSDVFGLGCVLYEITTAHKPFTGEHDPQVMASIVLGKFTPPGVLRRGYPAGLEAIVMKALANEPNDRFSSADHMRRALLDWLRVTGPPLGAEHVAALMRQRCGSEVDARARAIDEALGLLGVPPQADPTMGAPHDGFTGVVLAAVIGALLGLGVLAHLKTVKRARATANAALAAEGGLKASSPSSLGSSPEPAIELPDGPRTVRLHVVPSSAVLIVNGSPLPLGSDMVARPEDGGSLDVLVRADRYEDTIVVVDSATPDDIEVALSASRAPTKRAAPRGEEPPHAIAPPAPGGAATPNVAPPAPGGAATQPVLTTPPNPYD